jgi:hypothetical protein
MSFLIEVTGVNLSSKSADKMTRSNQVLTLDHLSLIWECLINRMIQT